MSCNNSNEDKISFWKNQKNNFKYHNKIEFVINDTLLADLITLKKVPLHIRPWIDTVYLYSWQNSDKNINEFAVVGIDGQYGPSIYYITTDKNDSLISSSRIAGTDDSGDEWSLFKAIFVTKDTFFVVDNNLIASYRDTFEIYKATKSGMILHAVEKNGEISVILKDYSDSMNLNK